MSPRVWPGSAWVLGLTFLGGCAEQDGSREFMPASESEMVYEVTLESPYTRTTSAQGTPGPCDPRGMEGYALASSLARRIAEGNPWDFNDDDASLALIDSFQHSRNRAFYSAVLLRTLERADGCYAEPLGMALHSELLDHPCSMLSCCWENGCDGREGLLLWTNAIAMEIMIDHEEDPWAAFMNYGEQVEARAKTECDLQTGSRANEFLYEIGAHLKHALQRDSIDASR